ncbi:hypothetical protein J2T13_001898 [Paenibacillus sp. DS2015]|uniref:copper amine oxidase N-terminal domain-containing protein n=1 Tax=Paenibacillus sp. DS2015 TaxID=3373917 RepID=UPI003D1EDB48
MKKKLVISLFAVVFLLSAVVGLAFAKGTIKIVVNGQAVSPDVAPRMIDNRVMVPISYVSKALGANVSWDQKNQTVTIKDRNVSSQEDIWEQELNIGSSSWAGFRNLIAIHIAGFDNRNDELIKSVAVEGFDLIPIGGMYPAILDYEIIDAQSTKNALKVRVKVITYEDKLFGEIWDYEIVQGKIKTWKRVKYFDVNSYTVFPGLSYKNK